jgi:hypothetical protein
MDEIVLTLNMDVHPLKKAKCSSNVIAQGSRKEKDYKEKTRRGKSAIKCTYQVTY